MTVRVGVVGAGVMGADHVTTLHRWVSGAEVTRVADLDAVRAETVAAGVPGARALGDPVTLVRDPPVDAVVVASADASHADLVLACLRERKPVLCEKPLAPTLEECRRLVEAKRALLGPHGTPLVSVGFMRRFDPGYQELRAQLASGGCGTPLLVHCVSRGVSSAPGATSASSITGSAVHEFDVLPWLLGSPVTEVAWHAPRPALPDDGLQDPQLLLVRTADGVLSTVEVFLNAGYGYDIRCEVVGTRGALTLAEPVRLLADRAGTRSAPYAADWRPRFADAYRLELQTWVDTVRGGHPAGGPPGQSPGLPTAHDGLVAAAVSEAAIAAMSAGGRPVPVRVPLLGPNREGR